MHTGAEALRALLHKLDSASGPKEDREVIRKHLTDNQAVFQSLHDRLRRAQDEVKEKEDVVKDLTDLIEEKELAESGKCSYYNLSTRLLIGILWFGQRMSLPGRMAKTGSGYVWYHKIIPRYR